MWFRTFIINSIGGVFGLLGYIGGGFGGIDSFREFGYSVVGAFSLMCFFTGIYKVIKFICNKVYDIQSRRNKK